MIIDFNVMAGTFPDGRIVTVSDVLYLMDRAKIDKAVISTPGTLDDSEENHSLYYATRPYPDRLIPAGIINPKRSQAHEEYARVAQYGFMAVKFDAINHGYQALCCSAIEELLRKIDSDGKFVCITTGITTFGDPAQWLHYVNMLPQLKFVFLGMGAFDFGYGCVDYATRFSNIYLETSLQYEIQIIKKAIHLLAGERILFGSAMPSRIAETELLKLHAMMLTDNQLAQITHISAQQLLT